MTPRVSVIIPTRNGAHRLPDLLAALERQTADPASFEILLVDDASTDDTADVVGRSGSAQLLRSEQHLGCAGASNLALVHARGSIVAFTDDDTIPADDWIERGSALFPDGGPDVVGGHIELFTHDPPSVAEMVDLGKGYLDQHAMVEEGYAATANAWVRREVIERVGGFREIFSGQDQDRDLVERAVASGARLTYAPDVIVRHPARASVLELARKEYRLARGASELRRLSAGPVAYRKPAWTRVHLYIPWRHRESFARLEERGVRVAGLRRLQVRATQYVCLQLLQAAGSMADGVSATFNALLRTDSH